MTKKTPKNGVAYYIARHIHDGYELRVKPVAREWWLSTHPNGDPNHILDSKQDAERISYGKVIPVREVID